MKRTYLIVNSLLLACGLVALAFVLVPTAPTAAAPLPALTQTAEPPTATHTNTPEPTATATSTPLPTATATSTPLPTATATPEEAVIERADPAITKHADVSEARVGDLVTFFVTVTNRGNADARDVVVVDNLPPFLELFSAATSHGEISATPSTVTVRIDRLRSGEQVEITIVTRAIAPALPPDNRNLVTLTATNTNARSLNITAEANVVVVTGSEAATPVGTPDAASSATPTPEGTPATEEMPGNTEAPGTTSPTPTAPVPVALPPTGRDASPIGPIALLLGGLLLLAAGGLFVRLAARR